MINHPERITMAHIADIASGTQRHISDYVDLDRLEVRHSTRMVLRALRLRNKMRTLRIRNENKKNGG